MLIFAGVFVLLMLTFIIYKVIKNEKSASKFIKEIKIGDDVYIHTPNGVICKIHNIDGDKVILTLTVDKNKIYKP